MSRKRPYQPKRYVITKSELRGTCYHEFSRGHWNWGAHWRDDSLYLPDEILAFKAVFFLAALKAVLPNYSPYGVTEVSPADWAKIGELIRPTDRCSRAVYEQLAPWAEEVFREDGCFTILGI